MARQQRDPTWPFLCILACLFVLSAASPRAWEKFYPRGPAATTTPPPSASACSLAREPEPATADPVVLPELTVVPDFAPADSSEAVETPDFSEAIDEFGTLGELPSTALVEVAPAEKYASLPIAPELAEPESILSDLLPGAPALPAAEPELAEPQPVVDDSQPQPAVEPAEPAPVSEPVEPAVWREPAALVAQLGVLQGDRLTAAWAGEVGNQLASLGVAIDSREASAAEPLARLGQLAAESETLAGRIHDPVLAAELRRAGFALKRRLAVWNRVAGMVAERRAALARRADPESLALCLAEVATATAGPESGPAWRDYLMMDALQELVSGDRTTADASTAELVDKVLARLARQPKTDAQRALLASKPMVQFKAELACWKPESVDPAALLEHVEWYEQTGMQMLAHDVAADCLRLAASREPADRALARHLEGYYRNANFRLAVTQTMLDRLAPSREPEQMAVRETLLGLPVRGRSVARSEVGLVLNPDPHRMRLTLEVRGHITASTTSDAGLATFFNDSASMYVARKPLEIDLGGIRLLPLEVGADSHTRLRRIETLFDPIPILGSIAQGIAEAEYDESQPRARLAARRKVASRARQRIEQEAVEQLTDLRDRLSQKVFVPLDRLQVDPRLIDASTTADRLTMRVRLAGSEQLGAHTPRPRAPADSLLSLQVHASAVNNLLEGLELGGQTLSLAEIAARVGEKLNLTADMQLDPEHEDVRITFPETDGVALNFQEGRAVLTLSIARLEKAGRSWKNFQVRALYVPQFTGRSVELVREDYIQMSGQVSTRAQIVLRGIFAKTFSKNRPVPVLPQRIVDDPRLADVAVTQLVLDNGWLGLALAPTHRTAAQQSPVARR